MSCLSEVEEQEGPFFDALDDVVSISDANDTNTLEADSNPMVEGVLKDFGYGLWIRSPSSVGERRSKFIKWMGMNLDQSGIEHSVDNLSSVEREEEMNKMRMSSCFMDDFFSSRSSMSCLSNMNSSEEFDFVENSARRDGETVEQHVEDNDGREVGLDRLAISEESESVEVSLTYQREIGNEFKPWTKRAKKGWVKTLRSITCMMDRQGESDNTRLENGCAFSGCRIRRVKVRQCKKQTKELSALYMGQDIKAHEGSIFTMKFSPDGQYLASAGEDGIVRLWQVVEDERCNEIDIPELDTSCIYFTVNDLSELTPLFKDKEKVRKVNSLKKTSDSACIIFPPKVFRLLEKPLHEFHGHRGEILDLSWSNNNVSDVIISVIQFSNYALWILRKCRGN